jgi:hypothetical protein
MGITQYFLENIKQAKGKQTWLKKIWHYFCIVGIKDPWLIYFTVSYLDNMAHFFLKKKKENQFQV